MPAFTFPIAFPPGLNSDDTTFAAKGFWADGSNVRFSNGQPQTIRGQIVAFTLSGGTTCTAIGTFKDPSGASHVAYGTFTELWSSAGMNPPIEITPSGGAGSSLGWSLQAWGDQLLAAPYGGTLYKYTDGVDTIASAITQAPAAITAMLVTNERQVLAFGCNEEASGTFNGMCIRGSDLEDYTDWTTSATNNAFEHILEGTGSIVAARRVGSYIAVWTDTALYQGQYIGDPSQTYRFDLVSEGVGLIALNAVAVDEQTAYWLSPDLRLRSWTPGSLPVEIPCPIQKDFFDHLSRANQSNCRVSALPAHGEIWVHYPDTRDTLLGPRCTRYLAYCVNESAMAQRPVWFRGAMVINAVLDSATLTPILTAYDPGAYLTSAGLNIRVVEHGTVATTGVSLNWFIQSADQYVNEGQLRTGFQRCVPDIKDQIGDVSLTLYCRDRPQSTPVTKGPYTLAVGATKKDLSSSGMIASVKFSGGATTGSYMRLGRPVFECMTWGAR